MTNQKNKLTEKFLIAIILLLSVFPAYAQRKMSPAEQASYALLNRLLPAQKDKFAFSEVSSSVNKDFFEVSSVSKKILIRGNSAVSMASGLNWYLTKYCHAQVSLNYNQLDLPKILPAVLKPERVETPFDYRYFFNYCTYGYTMPWWDWQQWEKMIDYMAMKGINMPLAMIGQEAVWQEVYEELGVTNKQLKDFFVGPAHLPWGWMGNIDGMAGPLPDTWIKKRKDLQIKVLARMRSLGMKPVLQGFTGHVPQKLKELYPQSKIFQIDKWAGVDGTYFLDPTDSLFQKIGSLFIKKQTAMYGTDHLYDADCFIEVNPPSADPKFLADVGKSVYQSMAKADPEAIWVLQGWFFIFKKDFWTKERGSAFLNGIPKNRAIVLDLYGEKNPTWNKTDVFYGQPWIWNVICNEDQKVNMSGDLNAMQQQFQNAFTSEIKNNLKGIGVIPEGLGYNPIVQDFIFEKAWNQTVVDVPKWVSSYAANRYGAKNNQAIEAWNYLLKTVYGRTRTMWSPLNTSPRLSIFEPASAEDERHVRKDFTITKEDPFAWDFNVYDLSKAANLLLSSSNLLKNEKTYRFDLTNVWRELLHSLSHVMINDLSMAYTKKDQVRFKTASANMIKLLDDIETITGTNENFLVGKWLEDAKNWGTNEEERKYYEWNARTIITIWQPYPEGGLRDYAGKLWNGMVSGYYKPRWQMLIDYLKESLDNNTPFDPKKYDKELRAMDYKWTRSNNLYPSEPKGDVIAEAKKLQKEYAHYFEK